jgi:hypothetical protein
MFTDYVRQDSFQRRLPPIGGKGHYFYEKKGNILISEMVFDLLKGISTNPSREVRAGKNPTFHN